MFENIPKETAKGIKQIDGIAMFLMRFYEKRDKDAEVGYKCTEEQDKQVEAILRKLTFPVKVLLKLAVIFKISCGETKEFWIEIAL